MDEAVEAITIPLPFQHSAQVRNEFSQSSTTAYLFAHNARRGGGGGVIQGYKT